MDIDRCLNPYLEPVGALSTLIHQAHGVCTRRGDIANLRLPPYHNLDRGDVSRDDGTARQCASVGDSLNNEQGSDCLSNSSSRQMTFPKVEVIAKYEPESRREWVGTYPQAQLQIVQ